ncbi:MAG TPA: hypothetical protein VKF59_05435 [Candidatus Dormibacteraeota bacterium]|nr:hypothetical protein [Candidatus Dormibacteraeota bacterium]
MAADLDLTHAASAASPRTARWVAAGAGLLVLVLIAGLTGWAALPLVVCVVSGAGLTYLSGLPLTVEERLAYGTVVGAAVLATLDFLLALVAGLGLDTVLAGAAGALAISAPGWRHGARRVGAELNDALERWRRREPWPLWALLAICWPFTLVVLGRAYTLGSQGLEAGSAGVYADWAAHLTYAGSFAFGHNFPPQFPVDPGHPMTYPFLIDLLAASFVPLGTSLTSSLVLSSGLLALAFPAVMYLAGLRLAGSRGAATLAVLVFTLSGGLGFLLLFQDLRASGLAALANPPRLYTQDAALNFQWLNPVLAWMLPQRSVLFGFCLALLVMAMLWVALGVRPETGPRDLGARCPRSGGADEERSERPPGRERAPQEATPEVGCMGPKDPAWFSAALLGRREDAGWAPFAFAGVVAGITPLCHLHAYGTIVALAGFWALLSPRRQWAAFFVPALVLGLPVAAWLLSGGAPSLRLQVWWLADTPGHHDGPVWFWLKNTSLLVPAMAAAFLWRGLLPVGIGRRLAPIWLWFAVPNFVVFQPWDWDNTKFFAYWALFGALPVGALLARLVRGRLAARVVAYALAAALMLSGALDLGRALDPAATSALFTSSAGVGVADWARTHTDPGATFLVAPVHNEPIPTLAGRRVMVGYGGWLWTYGLSDWQRRTADAQMMLQGDPSTPALLRRYRIDYVVLGPEDAAVQGSNRAYYDQHEERVFTDGDYVVYRVR